MLPVSLLFNLPYLTSVLDILARPMGFWGQNTNLMDLNYPTIPQLDVTSKAKNHSHSGTQCHPPILFIKYSITSAK